VPASGPACFILVLHHLVGLSYLKALSGRFKEPLSSRRFALHQSVQVAAIASLQHPCSAVHQRPLHPDNPGLSLLIIHPRPSSTGVLPFHRHRFSEAKSSPFSTVCWSPGAFDLNSHSSLEGISLTITETFPPFISPR
jgi:hypothetical protein